MKPAWILESDEVVDYLERRGLVAQYIKAKRNILDGWDTKVFLRQRLPKGGGVWYFRINLKYRAWARVDKDGLKVFAIDDHQ